MVSKFVDLLCRARIASSKISHFFLIGKQEKDQLKIQKKHSAMEILLLEEENVYIILHYIYIYYNCLAILTVLSCQW